MQEAFPASHWRNELTPYPAPSQSCATLIGPEPVEEDENVRCTTPNEPVHGGGLLPLPVPQTTLLIVPFSARQARVTLLAPALAGSESVPSQVPAASVRGTTVPPPSCALTVAA